MDDLKRQAERFGADIRNGIVTKADLSKAPYTFVVDDEKEITADTVIISTGATAKYLGLEDEKKYAGMRVSACATCDGFFYRKKTVVAILPAKKLCTWQDWPARDILWYVSRSFVLLKSCRSVY